VFYCLRLRPDHILCGLPTRHLTEFAGRHDDILRGAIAHILGLSTLCGETERQIFSPQTGSAGFSFTESSLVAPIAYVASLALSLLSWHESPRWVRRSTLLRRLSPR
jgi:hypothetical protein